MSSNSPFVGLTAKQLVAIYNHHFTPTVNRFQSIEAGIARLTALLEENGMDTHVSIRAVYPDAALPEPEAASEPEAPPAASEPEASPEPDPVADEPLFVRDVSFRIEGVPGKADALTWARNLARKLKLPIAVYRGDDRLETVDAAYLKAYKASQKKGGAKKERTPSTGPRPHVLKAIELCSRPEGATRGELSVLTERSQPWTSILKDAAARYGYAYSTETVDPDSNRGGRLAYRLATPGTGVGAS